MKLIIDVDTGIDDAQAIMMAVSQPHVEVLAVTCVNGNVDLNTATRNTNRVLKLCGRQEIPVYQGAEHALLGLDREAGAPVHGQDGLGDCPHQQPDVAEVTSKVNTTENAPLTICRLVNQFPGEVTLVALAPLTNIAIALKIDPSLGSKLKNVVIMGGSVRGVGNITSTGEFNFYADPEAAHIVLKELKCPTQIVTWEVCQETYVPWEWYHSLHKRITTMKSLFHKAINQTFVTRKIEVMKSPGYYSCDPLAMAVALDPSMVIESEDKYCTVELQGQQTRGQMVIDWRKWGSNNHNAQLVMKVDTEKFMILLEQMIL